MEFILSVIQNLPWPLFAKEGKNKKVLPLCQHLFLPLFKTERVPDFLLHTGGR
jgi:hypothetical protein